MCVTKYKMRFLMLGHVTRLKVILTGILKASLVENGGETLLVHRTTLARLCLSNIG